ncbi:Conserved_hypothetical protein [Hexamita inflata]|uniref:Uncharacterized protein n=1 Tax=Hexamita inflata TaxID=28002 RepID=A0AA86RC84_9EUKA|nr:Conserved hypothetical protein [Hexamita inflata]
MNASQRLQRSLELRASTKVIDALDYSRHKEVTERPFQKTSNLDKNFCHGMTQPTDHVDMAQTTNYSEYAVEKLPRRDRINSQYLNLADYPENRPMYKPSLETEVAKTMMMNLEEPRHQHTIIQKSQTAYCTVGEQASHGYETDKTDVYGAQTNKQGEGVAAFLSGVYIDRGYTIKKMEIPKENIKREVKQMYTTEPENKATMMVAGLTADRGKGLPDVMAANYGAEDPNYNYQMKTLNNVNNDTQKACGLTSEFHEERPQYLGGKKIAVNLGTYRRQ